MRADLIPAAMCHFAGIRTLAPTGRRTLTVGAVHELIPNPTLTTPVGNLVTIEAVHTTGPQQWATVSAPVLADEADLAPGERRLRLETWTVATKRLGKQVGHADDVPIFYALTEAAEAVFTPGDAPCPALGGACLGQECQALDAFDEDRFHAGPAYGMTGSYGRDLLEFNVEQWPGKEPHLSFCGNGDWPSLTLAEVDQLIADETEHLAALRTARAQIAALIADEAGTRPCGHDDYHNPHAWADRPHLWCPGLDQDDDTTA